MGDTDRLGDAFDRASRAAGEAAVRRPVTETPSSRKREMRDLFEHLWEQVEAQDAEIVRLRATAEASSSDARRMVALEEQMSQLQDELDFVQRSRDDTMADLGRARDTIRELQESLLLAQQAPAPPALATAAASPSGTGMFEAWLGGAVPVAAEPPTPDASPADRLASAFAHWCRDGGALNGRPDLFQTTLRASLPDADVRVVYRDADSPARPVALRPGATGNSAIPYWLVVYDGQHALLPQPMGPQQFRELAPCFDGTAAPATLTAIEPATVRPSGDGVELVAPGHVL